MRYGSAIVEKRFGNHTHVIQVQVAVDRPANANQSYIRCADKLSRTAAGAGAWSGARFARTRVDTELYAIDITDIAGDIDGPEAGSGAAVACVAATWGAYGVDWVDVDLGNTFGWSLRRKS